jgi:ribosomal protein S18 acetylase RimI-like enzyme
MIIRSAKPTDIEAIEILYRTVARSRTGIARTEAEITTAYVQNNVEKGLNTGFCLVAEHPDDVAVLIGEIHCSKLGPQVFDHVLGDLTIVVHPDWQGRGVGRRLFSTLLESIKTKRPDILRVELIARESNVKAIALYEQLGFRIEGRFEGRIARPNGSFEADIPMAWQRNTPDLT